VAHRLTGEDWLDPSDVHLYAFAYEYDAAGNRLRKTFNGEVTYYNYNNLNQLEAESVLGGDTTDYTWTADGEMETKHEAAGWTYYTWDVDESLRRIAAPETTLDNKYNSQMQRVQRVEDGAASDLIYDNQKLIAEAGASNLSRYYLSESGSVYSPLLAQFGSEHWFLGDALGTTLGLTDASGGLTDAFRYEAFGTSLGRTGSTATPYQYVGGYGYFREASVELEQVWWRWYHQCSSRWISDDPLDPSYFVYARNDPARLIDATGLFDWGRVGKCMGEGVCMKVASAVACWIVEDVFLEACAVGCTLSAVLGPEVLALCMLNCIKNAELLNLTCNIVMLPLIVIDVAVCFDNGCTPCLDSALPPLQDLWHRLRRRGGGPQEPPHHVDSPQSRPPFAYV